VLSAVSSDGRIKQRLSVSAGDVREPAWGPTQNEELEVQRASDLDLVLAAGLAACQATPQMCRLRGGGRPHRRAGGARNEHRADRKVDVTGTGIQGQDPAVRVGVLAQRSIFYDLDQYDIKEQYRPLVEAHARYLRDHPGRKMLIQGNTDERGQPRVQHQPGQKRSEGVKTMLLLLGAREEQVESVSLAEEKPRSEGHDEQAWSQNRRSDILYQGEY
jgi:peptidoglycan-associated lipoprotein